MFISNCAGLKSELNVPITGKGECEQHLYDFNAILIIVPTFERFNLKFICCLKLCQDLFASQEYWKSVYSSNFKTLTSVFSGCKDIVFRNLESSFHLSI